MTAAATALFVLAGLAAAADWLAVARRPSPVEYVAKPLVLASLLAAAVVLDPQDSGQRAWFVAALALSLAGDVFLLPKPDAFVAGLASFLLGHVALIVGFAQVAEVSDTDRLVAPLVLVPMAVPAFIVLRAVRRTEPAMRVPVLAYISVIAAMVVWSVVEGDAVGVAGAALFATSDSILAVNRFDRQRAWMPLAVIVTYHLAQGLLVVSLTR